MTEDIQYVARIATTTGVALARELLRFGSCLSFAIGKPSIVFALIMTTALTYTHITGPWHWP